MSPEMEIVPQRAYGAALLENNTVVGPTTLVLFGTGFGVTNPGAVSGGVVSAAAPLVQKPCGAFRQHSGAGGVRVADCDGGLSVHDRGAGWRAGWRRAGGRVSG